MFTHNLKTTFPADFLVLGSSLNIRSHANEHAVLEKLESDVTAAQVSYCGAFLRPLRLANALNS